jgi:predicted DNA-binding WGR domain protein
MVLAHLHRIDPEANMARFCSIDVLPTLFGESSVLRCWGRIGTRGRTSLETWPTAAEAEAAAGRTLRQKSHRGYRPTGKADQGDMLT